MSLVAGAGLASSDSPTLVIPISSPDPFTAFNVISGIFKPLSRFQFCSTFISWYLEIATPARVCGSLFSVEIVVSYS